MAAVSMDEVGGYTGEEVLQRIKFKVQVPGTHKTVPEERLEGTLHASGSRV